MSRDQADAMYAGLARGARPHAGLGAQRSQRRLTADTGDRSVAAAPSRPGRALPDDLRRRDRRRRHQRRRDRPRRRPARACPCSSWTRPTSCSGTSAWSSRLIHGGLRYLEHGELRLVHESLHDRERLLHIAPHLVTPMPFVVPLYPHNHKPAWMFRAGMVAFDALSMRKSVPRHRRLNRKAVAVELPSLAARASRARCATTTARSSSPSGSSWRRCSRRSTPGRSP